MTRSVERSGPPSIALATMAFRLAVSRTPNYVPGGSNHDQIAEAAGPHWKQHHDEGQPRCGWAECAEYFRIIDCIARGEAP